jgi:lipopolysaccharide/colanic/teichoic acid biosynthesis glycosyltransferase
MITRSRYGNARAISKGLRTPASKSESKSGAKSRSERNRTDRRSAEYGKRLFDVMFSLSVLVVFFPVYIVLALLIYINSPGPVWYVQRRVGRNGRIFGCIKFRTMVVGADQMLMEMLDTCPDTKTEFETDFKLKDDPRITPIGKWLRMTSLDEFPQFWNVLMGDMSVVGPRPLVTEELHKYGSAIDKVLTIRPGITGLWQVSGRNDIPYDRRVQIDLYYVHAHNFWMDLSIVVKTVGVVIFPKGNGAY